MDRVNVERRLWQGMEVTGSAVCCNLQTEREGTSIATVAADLGALPNCG